MTSTIVSSHTGPAGAGRHRVATHPHGIPIITPARQRRTPAAWLRWYAPYLLAAVLYAGMLAALVVTR